jgi:hypothetical protein
MIKLLEILQELISTTHYDERKQDRIINIKNITIPKEALSNFTLNQIEQPLIKYIQDSILIKLKSLESQDIPSSQNYYVGYKFYTPVIETNGKQYPITIKSSDLTGTYYYVIIHKERLITLVLTSEEDLRNKITSHLERKGISTPLKIIQSAPSPINLNKLMGIESKEEKISEKDIPYKVRTDYRINTPFEHDAYGKGTIVATSSGNTGKSDQRGMLDWIEVDFGKPFLSGGKLQKTRKIPNIYAKTYFGVETLNEENKPINPKYFQQILDKSNGLSISNRKYFQDIINSVIKQNNLATPRQYDLLQRLKIGDFKYHSKN